MREILEILEKDARTTPEEVAKMLGMPPKAVANTIKKMEKDGAWQAAFDKNLGPAGITAPPPPAVDRY